LWRTSSRRRATIVSKLGSGTQSADSAAGADGAGLASRDAGRTQRDASWEGERGMELRMEREARGEREAHWWRELEARVRELERDLEERGSWPWGKGGRRIGRERGRAREEGS